MGSGGGQMIFHQYFLACLSHASYLVGDESAGRAVVVDPAREVPGYRADVGRPDLLADEGVSAAELAGQLSHSLRDQLLTLPPETRVYPAHGAGSACGKSLSSETSSTIGEQRSTNYALADMDESDFVRIVTEGQPLT